MKEMVMTDPKRQLDDLEAWCRDPGKQMSQPVDVDAVLAAVAAARELEALESAFEFVRLHHSTREPVDVYYCKSVEHFLKLPSAMRANPDLHPDLPKVPSAAPAQKRRKTFAERVAELGTMDKAPTWQPVTDEPKLVAVPVKGNPGWVALEPVPDEPDKDLLNLAFPCPPVDKYAEHRRKLEADGITEGSVALETCAKQPMGTANLHAGLESEKVWERVKAFPPAGRNPR